MAAQRPHRKSFAQLFPQLFLFPLLIVTVGVLVYLFFIASAQDTRSVEELIADIESEGAHARKQDLYALAIKVRDLTAPDGKPAYFDRVTTEKLLGLLERAKDDAALQEYVVLALGRAGEPALVAPVMERLALEEGGTELTRVYAVQSLGLSRSPEARAVLERVLERFAQPESWELRWNALGALANIGGEEAAGHLRRALADGRREVRWSAACWLANFFKDPSGIETLRRLCDWTFLDAERGDQKRELHPAEKERYMVMALEGIYALEGAGAEALIREKSKDTRSARVHDTALRLLGKLAEGSAKPAAEAAGGRSS